jgi:hypothetical protein
LPNGGQQRDGTGPSPDRGPSARRGEGSVLEFNVERIRQLRRCTRCILPETFPFITFDAAGVCNYCAYYRIKNAPKPIEGSSSS